MAEIQGIGVTHYPGLAMPDADMSVFLRRTLTSEKVPAALKDPRNWPPPMRAEWGDDQGAQAAAKHRERLGEAFRHVRRELDAFNPDFVLIWGDDQYENFREEIVPPFCVFILDEVACTPLAHTWGAAANIWGEPPDKVFTYRGHPAGARHLTRRLIEAGFDIPYAYTVRDPRGLAHAFVNTLLFLDYDRRGFSYPVVPFHVNCYGSSLVRSRGGTIVPGGEREEPDPPAPSAKRCFEVGRATAQILRASPWRVTVIGSSSWSHAFLTEKNSWLYPDIDADRQLLEQLKAGRYAAWAGRSLAEMEAAGQHEVLNWVCLAGAMAELGRAARIVDYVETWVFNSNKCFAIFPPVGC
ncbi:MAG: extradiol ring-cleavage dioxygenase [Candidatus Rokubacteria bacterium]|nr:extradiol ring-cleavage dioxygenase [Candidatus Rokubacteria bacterium]